jgi:orotidine-5'-phosphate decarboxylase
MASKGNDPRVIVALDFAHAQQALRIARTLPPSDCRVKVGQELFTRAGPGVVERLVALGFEVFLDLKFHDIPSTVAGACAAAAQMGCWMVDVHASGGRAMIEAAREALERGNHRPALVAVTLLTSLDEAAVGEIGFNGPLPAAALRLACLARDAGADGVVCAAAELAALRAACGAEFCYVTPGIRPDGAGADDQSRVSTPPAALRSGATYLVIGRPITRAADPAAALREINASLGAAAREDS